MVDSLTTGREGDDEDDEETGTEAEGEGWRGTGEDVKMGAETGEGEAMGDSGVEGMMWIEGIWVGIVGDGLVVSGVKEGEGTGDLEGEAVGDEGRVISAVGGVRCLVGVTKAEGEGSLG